MSHGSGFNLLDEPWIMVLGPDGKPHELSMLDVFEQAPRLGMITGEVPTQAFAITRLLLAFLHRAVDGPEDRQEWADLWRLERFPTDRIGDYAQAVRHRFELFDVAEPFFQVPGLRTAKGDVAGLEKLVADVPNGEPFFTTRSASNLRWMSAAEAARWLVHVHAFDPSGIKSGAVDDLKAKNGKGYPIGPGWSGQIGGVVPQGANLRETLLLNLISRDFDSYVEVGGIGDVPPWEREPDGPQWQEKREPRGALDLYTWQTRRVRLVGDRGGVTGVVLANGDKIVPQNRQNLDPHTAWRYSDPQTKKAKATVYMPRLHDPDRSVWRGIAAILPAVSGSRQRKKTEDPVAPRVLEWISDLAGSGLLPTYYVSRLRITGVEYGAQSATYSEIVDDILPLSVALLRQDAPAVGQMASNAVGDAEQVAKAVWSFAENIAQAGGAEPKSGAGDRARTEFYALLERPYREWVKKLGPDTDRSTARAEWQRVVRSATRPVSQEIVTAASPTAWRGRLIHSRLVTVGLAQTWLWAAITRALPLAFVDSDKELEVAG